MKRSIQVRTNQNPQFVDIWLPLTARKLAQIDNSLGRVQIGSRLTAREHLKLAERLRRFPKVYLRVFELFGEPEQNLDFLQHYKGLRRLTLNLRHAQSFEGIRHVANSLEYLSFGSTKIKISLDFLAEFTRLKGLELDGHTQGIETISKLKNLEELTLGSITLTDLGIVAQLPKLWSLEIGGSRTNNLAALPRLKGLKHLKLVSVSGLSDLSAISEATALQEIFLSSMKGVTIIPPLQKLKKLRRVTLSKMNGITDLSPLLGAKSLQEVLVSRAVQINPNAFRPLQSHPSLKAIGFGLGSDRKNAAVAMMFPQLQHSIKYPFVFK